MIHNRLSRSNLVALTVSTFALLSFLTATSTDAQSAKAVDLVKNRQYNDAIKVLTQDIAGKPDSETAKACLLLGECYFLTRQFEQSRTFLQKAKTNTTIDADKLSAEYRLACVAFRANDENALKMIDTYVGDHAADSRSGKLLVYRMLLLAAKGKSQLTEIEKTHENLYTNIKKYGAETAGEADEVLCDFYRKIGSPEKAESVYTRVALNLAKQITQRKADKEAVPASLEKAHDNAALNLGIIYLEKNQKADAVKWLETVRYDFDMKMKARLFLAKLAYEANDFASVSKYVGDKDFLDALPAGPIRSDVYLVLALAEKANPNGSPVKIQDYLRQIAPDSKGYAQAQSALGDLFRERTLTDSALQAYANAKTNPDYAPNALFWIGAIHMDLAAKDSKTADKHYQAAAEAFKELAAKYPTSPLIKQIKEKAQILAAKGIDMQIAMGDEENLKNWQKIISEKPGTPEATQALLSLMRAHMRRVADEKTGKVVKAPDYPAAASAAEKLLDAKIYSGTGLAAESWKAILAEANYSRGKAELASIAKQDSEDGKFIKSASPDRASKFLAAAQDQLLNGKPVELARGIELAILEARFKSDSPEQRELAQKSFAELADRYGSDPQFQALGMEIAEWLQKQGRYPEAAKQYAVIAEHPGALKPEDVMKIWFTAGSLWSRAGEEALGKQDAAAYTILIYPKEAIALGDSFVLSYPPLQRPIVMKWPKGGALTAQEALNALSQTTGIPFIASRSIASAMATKMLNLKDGPTTPAQVLSKLLDSATERVSLNTGLSDGTPTLKTAGDDPDDLDGGKLKTLEIYDPRTALYRYKPLTNRIGDLPKATKNAGIMLYSILQRVEENTGIRITWADGVDKQSKQEFDLQKFPGVNSGASAAEVLEKALALADLRARLQRVELAPQYFDNARACFNHAHKIDPKSTYGERSLIAVAVNFYQLKDYDKMRIVLREYLKTFDASSPYYQQACFWVGWTFENQNNLRDATAYYSRAAAERAIITKPNPQDPKLSRDQLRALFSNDSQVSLMEPVTAELNDLSLEQLAEFVRSRGHLSIRIDASAQASEGKFNPGRIAKTPVFTVLADALDEFGLSLKVENLSPEIAEKAFFRMATVYQKDGAMDQAVEACTLLLQRYPSTTRRRDVQNLLISIYKGLKQYGKVVSTLQQLRSTATDPAEKRRLDYELASTWFDVADYPKASAAFKNVLAASSDGNELLAARDAYAKSLLREEKLTEAQTQFAQLAKDEPAALRKLTYTLMAFALDEILGKVSERQYPEDAQKWIIAWEKLTDAQRAQLTAADYAKATWIYYTLALIDLHQNRRADALTKLQAVTSSPDDFIAADAAFRIAILAIEEKQLAKAREALETLLLTTRSSETTVRALYTLGQVLESTNKPQQAAERYRQLAERYPLSPYVALSAKSPVMNASTQTNLESTTKP